MNFISYKHKKKNLDSFIYLKTFIFGFGFSFFVYNQKLYLLLNYSHYLVVDILKGVFIFRKKKKIYLLSANNRKLNLFVKNLKLLKRDLKYSIQGLHFFTNSSDLKTKIGKKTQIN